MHETIEYIDDTSCSEYRPKVLLAQSNLQDLQEIAKYSDICDKYDYVLATTGFEVIDKINEERFDAVILGLKFPDITGSTIAYLIHEFDPLLSITFLTSYKSSVLASIAHEIGCNFIDKTTSMLNLTTLCEDIYFIATEMPCDNMRRKLNREFVKDRRERYNKYQKLSVPKALAEVVGFKRL